MAHEVVLTGVPVSAQTKDRRRYDSWKQRVAAAARETIREEDRYELEAVHVVIIQYAFDWTEGDLDNIAKPILDGLNGPAFSDDQWVTQLTLRRTELGAATVEMLDPPAALADALQRAYVSREDFIYVRIEREVDHRSLPWTR